MIHCCRYNNMFTTQCLTYVILCQEFFITDHHLHFPQGLKTGQFGSIWNVFVWLTYFLGKVYPSCRVRLKALNHTECYFDIVCIRKNIPSRKEHDVKVDWFLWEPKCCESSPDLFQMNNVNNVYTENLTKTCLTLRSWLLLGTRCTGNTIPHRRQLLVSIC